MSVTPTPPTPPPRRPTPPANGRPADGLEQYNTIAETVFGPSLRVRDNLIQAAIIIGCTGLGVLGGLLYNGWVGALFGGAGAMILSTLLSGGVLMVLGWVRAAKKRG